MALRRVRGLMWVLLEGKSFEFRVTLLLVDDGAMSPARLASNSYSICRAIVCIQA